MSTYYYLCCETHKELVSAFSQVFSGALVTMEDSRDGTLFKFMFKHIG